MRQDRHTRRYKPPSPTPDNGRNASAYASRNGAAASLRSDTLYRVIVLGYILAASMPPLGLIIGIGIAFRTTKINARHGLWIIGVSIVASVVWAVIIASGALSTPSADF
jgi:hypothetical protein